jgi:hypothetical protein
VHTRIGKIGPGKLNNQLKMIQLQPSAYASKRSSSIPSGEPSSRQSLLSKGNSNDSEKIKKGAVNQAYQSTGGVTSVDSNYGP